VLGARPRFGGSAVIRVQYGDFNSRIADDQIDQIKQMICNCDAVSDDLILLKNFIHWHLDKTSVQVPVIASNKMLVTVPEPGLTYWVDGSILEKAEIRESAGPLVCCPWCGVYSDWRDNHVANFRMFTIFLYLSMFAVLVGIGGIQMLRLSQGRQ
jgi:hypothetical protein